MALAKLKDGRIIEIAQSLIDACPRGGGFLMRIPVEDIAEINIHPKLRFEKIQVEIEDPPFFEAWVDLDERWNGWLCPRFEKDQAMDLIDWEEREMGMRCHYDEANDRFLLAYTDGEEPPRAAWYEDLDPDDENVEICEGFDLETPEGTKRVYGIGSHSWIWSKHEPITEGADDEN
jgi:hypothetical protein